MTYAAIYNVTRALRLLLHSQLAPVSATAVVTLLPPGDALPAASGVNLYLYRVAESAFSRNDPWPGDRATPPSDQPALGLHLSYLLTPLGTTPAPDTADQGDDAHTMLGLAMLALHQYPVLNDIHIPGFDADAVLPAFLLNSFDALRVTLVQTNLEELSKIWATINQPYRLSVAYEVSLVSLTPTQTPPVGSLVGATALGVGRLNPPYPTELSPPQGPLARVTGGVLAADTLQIRGSGFGEPGQTPTVQVGGQPVNVQASPAPTDQALTVALPTDLNAGPQVDVQVALQGAAGMPLSFLISPWLARVTPIRTALNPALPADLTLALQGSGFTTSPQSVRWEAPGVAAVTAAPTAGGTDTQAAALVPPGLANGLYSVRLVLPDGSASNGRTLEVIPRLDSPIGVATAAGPVHQLTLNGARLEGADVRLVVDGATYQIGANTTNTNQIVYTLGRLLPPGPHTVAITVDGHLSRAVSMTI